MDRESRIAEIAEAGRKLRGRAPRGLWIAAFVIGGACAIGFVIAMLAHGEPGPVIELRARGSAIHHAGRADVTISPGLGAGLIAGLVAGVVIGIAIARQRAARHSSRNSP